jgi:MarR family transcriptional regulator, transcriptional regulator for hemolysin
MISALKSRLRQVAWRRLAPFGVTPEQFQALRALEDRPGLSHGQFTAALGLDKPSATRLLQGLARKGLARALPSPGDGRRQHLELTAGGRALLEDLRPFQRAIREGLDRGLAPEDLDRLRALLGTLMTNLEVLDASTPGPPCGDAHVDR